MQPEELNTRIVARAGGSSLPLPAVMRAKNFDQAIDWANATGFALTGNG